MPELSERYSEAYKEQCFYAWYSADRPVDIGSCVPQDDKGKKPSQQTLRTWRAEKEWNQRADVLDAQLSITLDQEIIARKKQDYIELTESGRAILKKGMEHLNDKGFDTAAAAVRAVGLGAEMVAKYSRAAEMVDAVLGKTDAQIEKEIQRLISRDEVIDVDSTSEEVDSTSEEIEQDTGNDSDNDDSDKEEDSES